MKVSFLGVFSDAHWFQCQCHFLLYREIHSKFPKEQGDNWLTTLGLEDVYPEILDPGEDGLLRSCPTGARLVRR